jgi:anti-sigma B factor antagonist
MEIEISELADGVVLVLPNDSIDTATSGALRDCLTAKLQQGSRRVVVDLSRVRYIDSSGLSSLVASANAFAAENGRLVLCSAPAGVLRILQLTKLDEYFQLAGDRGSALEQAQVEPAR